jgi:hypothetical protein
MFGLVCCLAEKHCRDAFEDMATKLAQNFVDVPGRIQTSLNEN